MPFPGEVCGLCGEPEESEWKACCGLYMCLSCEATHDREFFEGAEPLDDNP